MSLIKRITLGAAVVAALGFSACGSAPQVSAQDSAADRIEEHAAARAPYEPKHDVEYNNYNKAQKQYDDPAGILWCTTTWGNPSAPIVTIPIAGKLTSSSVSFFPGQEWVDRGNYSWTSQERKSVDGMYHGSPPPYRYGFTPGGQYVDFFNMPTVCTTALTKFTRQSTKVSLEVDPAVASAQQAAEEALKAGDHKGAEKALEAALNG